MKGKKGKHNGIVDIYYNLLLDSAGSEAAGLHF
jgi:hypothetical protein